MDTEKSPYNILIIEDKPGGSASILNYLNEDFEHSNKIMVSTFINAKEVFEKQEIFFDIVLLDLSLPEVDGMEGIKSMVALAGNAPVVIVSDYTSLAFSKLAISYGASDYLIKGELTPNVLNRAIVHNVERKNHVQEIVRSKENYAELFQCSPQPLITYNANNFTILNVNEAACRLYGYSFEEFLTLTLIDIRPKSEVDHLHSEFKRVIDSETASKNYVGIFKHQKKNGETFMVEIYSNPASQLNNDIRVSLVTDVSLRVKYTEMIENQNKRLKEITWIQSHIVRAPVARILGLVALMSDKDQLMQNCEQDFILNSIRESANELDIIIHDINEKASKIRTD